MVWRNEWQNIHGRCGNMFKVWLNNFSRRCMSRHRYASLLHYACEVAFYDGTNFMTHQLHALNLWEVMLYFVVYNVVHYKFLEMENIPVKELNVHRLVWPFGEFVDIVIPRLLPIVKQRILRPLFLHESLSWMKYSLLPSILESLNIFWSYEITSLSGIYHLFNFRSVWISIMSKVTKSREVRCGLVFTISCDWMR